MKFLSCAILVLALTSFVDSSFFRRRIRHVHAQRCRTHKDCPSSKYCKRGYYYCQMLPHCSHYGRCPSNLDCDIKTKRCVVPTVCHSHSHCDSASECCQRQYWRPSKCKKRPTEGQYCSRYTYDLCKKCVDGLQCTKVHEFWYECRAIPTTVPPTTEEPGSGESMDDTLGLDE